MSVTNLLGRLFWVSVVAVFGGSSLCWADADHPMNFSVTLSVSTECETQSNDQIREEFVIKATFTWKSPATDVSSYYFWVDGVPSGWTTSGYTSRTIKLVQEVRLVWPQDEAAVYEEIVGSYLGTIHEFSIKANRHWGYTIYDSFTYLPPNVLRIGYNVKGVAEGLPLPLDIVHEQQAAEGLDSQDIKALYGQSAGAARIASVIPVQNSGSLGLLRDARPQESTSDVIVQLKLVSAIGEPMTFTSPTHNELRLSMPTAKYASTFGSLPLTVSLYDPCEPNKVYPSYDIRQVISKYAGVLALPNLEGSYDSNAPVAFLKVSFKAEATADPNGGMQTSVLDPNAPATGPADPNVVPPVASAISSRSSLLPADMGADNFPALWRQRPQAGALA